MSSLFENARDEIRASLQRCFGRPVVVMLPDGNQKTVQGYIKKSESGGNRVKRLITDELLPPKATLMDEGKRYALVFSSPRLGKGDSQIVREYVMNLEGAGAKHGWSEYSARS